MVQEFRKLRRFRKLGKFNGSRVLKVVKVQWFKSLESWESSIVKEFRRFRKLGKFMRLKFICLENSCEAIIAVRL